MMFCLFLSKETVLNVGQKVEYYVLNEQIDHHLSDRVVFTIFPTSAYFSKTKVVSWCVRCRNVNVHDFIPFLAFPCMLLLDLTKTRLVDDVLLVSILRNSAKCWSKGVILCFNLANWSSSLWECSFYHLHIFPKQR